MNNLMTMARSKPSSTTMVLLFRTVLLVLLFCSSTISVDIMPSCRELEGTTEVSTEKFLDIMPSCRELEGTTEVSTEKFLDLFLDAYKETVNEVVNLQTSVWNYIPSYIHFEDSEAEGICDHIKSNIPTFERRRATAEANNISTKFVSATTTTNESSIELLEDGFQFDNEDDIDRYFSQLAKSCSQVIVDDTDDSEIDRFETECFDFLHSLTYDPRCTTRFDSRTKCSNVESTTTALIRTPREIIEEHFLTTDASLNIIIQGAGPVGLMLANALTMLQQRHTHQHEQENKIPPIRVLLLDTRADAPGRKSPYTRNWQANLDLRHFNHGITDPRLAKVFASLTEFNPEFNLEDNDIDETPGFTLPTNIIETLLLLSNRDNDDIKFLFGINPLDLVDDLRDIPNLVLVDATGHRIEPLKRGAACDDDNHDDDHNEVVSSNISTNNDDHSVIYNFRPPAHEPFPWERDAWETNNSNITDFYELGTFGFDFTEDYEFLEEHGHGLHIARSNDILYPIDKETGAPISVSWLDIHGASKFKRELRIDEDDNLFSYLYPDNGDFCEYCLPRVRDNLANRRKELYYCEEFCRTGYFSSSMSLIREDVRSLIYEGRFNKTFAYYSDEGWFPTLGWSFNPSEILKSLTQKILRDHGYSDNPAGMPVRDFYPALQHTIDTNIDTDNKLQKAIPEKDLKIVEVLRRISVSDTGGENWPTITLSTQQPFIYTEGIKKKKKLNECVSDNSCNLGDYLDGSQMIRIGDSFTTGDGLKGSGLFNHATMVGIFMDVILNKLKKLASKENTAPSNIAEE